MDKVRLDAVIHHVNNVLRNAQDKYRARPTPLLANAIYVRSGAHLTWNFPGGRSSVLSNFSCQQNLMRALVGLSNITGEEKYKNVACANIQYYFMNLQADNGLLRWGGHQFIDLRSLHVVGPQEKNGVHELKHTYPYYALMMEVNAAATTRLIQGFWSAHVSGKHMEVSRHGKFHHPLNPDRLSVTGPYERPLPFFESTELSFLSAGSDLIYAAAMHSLWTGDPASWVSAMRLADQYSSARNAITKLGAYQYSQPLTRRMAPTDDETRSHFGDRAQRQLGPDLEDSQALPPHCRKVLEGTMLLEAQAKSLYSHNTLMQLEIGMMAPDRGRRLLDTTIEGLLAFKQYAYQSQNNTFRPMLIDGTDLSFFVLKRNGYYGTAGSVFTPYPATCLHLLSFTRAYRATADQKIWGALRELALHQDLGDWGESHDIPEVNMKTSQDDPLCLFSVLDIYWSTKAPAYLALARQIGNNIFRNKFVTDISGTRLGYFTASKEHVYVNVDTIEPYALLSLHAAIEDREDAVPTFINCAGYTEGDYRLHDGTIVKLRDTQLYDIRTETARMYSS